MQADGVMVMDVVAVIEALNGRVESSQFPQPIRPAARSALWPEETCQEELAASIYPA